MKALLIGNLTIDHNLTESGRFEGPGGSVFFISRVLNQFEVKTTIVSSYGSDFPVNIISPSILFPSKPINENTLLFENTVLNDGKRTQKAFYAKDNMLPEYVSFSDDLKKDNDLVYITPVVDNIKPDLMPHLKYDNPDALFILVPQGLFRQIDEEGAVHKINDRNIKEYAEYADIVIFSDEDVENADALGKIIANSGKIAIVTGNIKGCTVFWNNDVIRIPAFVRQDIFDSTGAGDVFAGAFCFQYIKTEDIINSAVFANAAASLSLKNHAEGIKYCYQEIMGFIKNSKRRII